MSPAGAEALKTAEKIENPYEIMAAREKIHGLLSAMELQRLAKPQTIAQYREAARVDNTLEGARGFYQWVSERWEKAMPRFTALQGQIDQAIQQDFAGENDRAFLMEQMTVRHDFVGELEMLESSVKGKLDRMKKDRDAYDQLRNHPLVRNTGFLRLDASTKIPIPEAKVFLALTVPQRRELLKKVKEALPRATAYAKEAGDEKSAGLVKKYDKLLVDARTKGRSIGRVTEDKFRDGFKKISRQDKEEWLSGFPAEMKRYEDLWKNIRTTLKGPALEAMENKRDTLGYNQLFTEFGRVRAEESGAICTAYDGRLQKLQAERLISLHTRLSFSRDIREQPLAEQQHYTEQLDRQMEPYYALRQDIKNLKNKGVRSKLDALYDSPFHGLTEIRQEYLRLTGQAPASSASALADQQDLQNIRRDRVRKEVVKSTEILDTREKKERMIDRLTQLLRREDQTHYDQSDFSANVDNLRRDHQKQEQEKQPKPSLWSRVLGRKPVAPAEESPPETPAQSTLTQSQSVASLRAKNRQLESSSESGVSLTTRADEGFSRAKVTVGEQNRKVVRLDIGNREAMDLFLQEDLRLETGRDTVDFMAKEGGETERMHFQDILSFRKILSQQLF